MDGIHTITQKAAVMSESARRRSNPGCPVFFGENYSQDLNLEFIVSEKRLNNHTYHNELE